MLEHRRDDGMKYLIFDGNSIFNRAFYGIRQLTNREGLPTNAIYGFLNIYLKFVQELSPDYVSVAFDRKGPTFRHEAYDQYKAQRSGMPEDMAKQLPILKEVLAAMQVQMLELDRYEADDIIGTVSALCHNQGVECDIVTGDKDDLQLITDKVRVQLITTRMGKTDTTVMDEEAFREKYGLEPCRMIDLKALMGDSSDNIPGVAGVGEKTALKLLQTYGSLEEVYRQLEESPERESLKKKLREGREAAFMSYDLATICKEVPMEIRLEDAKMQPYDQQALRPLLEKLELKTLENRMCTQVEEEPAKECQEVCYQLWQQDTSLPWEELDVCSVALYDKGCALSAKGEVYLVQREDPWYGEVMGKIWQHKNLKKYCHDYKSILVQLLPMGMEPQGCEFDIFLGGYIDDPSQSGYSLAELCARYVGAEVPYDKKTGQDEKYAVAGVAHIQEIGKLLQDKLEANGQTSLYYEVEQPLCQVLAEMELHGFRTDRKLLISLGEEFDRKLQEYQQEIYDLAGETFNINSPKQLGVILFEKMGLPVVKKTKTGYSTDIDVLNKLAKLHPIARCIVSYRQMAKLKSTYVDGLLAVMDEKGYIHSSFNQTITQTGRLSSTEPNLQNIPVRQEMGREIRKVFVPEEGCVLVDADYSQIELRVLAHIADDETMIQAFRDGVDIHAMTASQVFHTPLEEVTSQMRSNAKAVNFGIVYGIGDFSLAEDLHITRKEAKQYIENYLQTYHGVREYMENVVKQAKEDGYVTTLLGRRRYIPEINSKNFNIREFGKRCAMNTPIQGSAADIIKIAMVRVSQKMKEAGLKSFLILQVHDELIVNAYEEELKQVREILKTEMEGAYTMKVKLEVDMSQGDSWYSAKG